MSTGKKRKYTFDKYRENRPIDIVNILYILFIVSFYPLYMDNKYFNITATRANTFMYSTVLYIILAIIAIVIENMMISYYTDDKIFVNYLDCKIIKAPEFWMGMFLLANVMAWVMAENKSNAFTGADGRRFGLGIVIIIALMFFIIASGICVKNIVFIFMWMATVFAFVVGILQHIDIDFLKLREKVAVKQKEMFISTFGNINTYASYICIVLPIFFAVFIFGRKVWARAIAYLGIYISAMAIITAKSDNVYLGILASFTLMFYISVLNKQMGRYMLGILAMALGLLTMTFLNDKFHGKTGHINGVAEAALNYKVMGAFLILIVIICFICYLIKKYAYESFYKKQSKKLLWIVTAIGIFAAVAVVCYGIKTNNELFVFNDKWGTYRGFIWKRSAYLHRDASFLQKLFGYGNESVESLMRKYYYDEMINITKKVYDNSHNEVLQYLVTTGLFGAASYIGLFVSSIVYMLKRAKGNVIIIACSLSAVAYFAQGLVNLNQPITTPFYFVVLAVGVGSVRYIQQGYGKYKKEK